MPTINGNTEAFCRNTSILHLKPFMTGVSLKICRRDVFLKYII